MFNEIPVAFAFGLLLGGAIIVFLPAPDGGANFTAAGMAMVIVISTAICTAIGALVRYLRSGNDGEK